MDDLEQIEQLTQIQSQLERLKDIKGEIVESERWNHEAAKELLKLALKTGHIPFESCANAFDLHPTANDGNQSHPLDPSTPKKTGMTTKLGQTSTKGKEWATGQPMMKRAIYHLLSDMAKESWLGLPCKSIPLFKYLIQPAVP